VGALAFAQHVKELERQSLNAQRLRAREMCRELHAAHTPLLETLQSQHLRATA
jgi:hypothetical protein